MDNAIVTPLGARPSIQVEPEELDTNPSDQQPPGVDEEKKEEEWEPQSLEEALLGE